MIVETVHVKERKQKGIFEIYTNQKPYYFRVAKKLEEDIQEGMIARFSKKQILYITKVITDHPDESIYTGKIRRIESVDPDKIVWVNALTRLKRADNRKKRAKQIEERNKRRDAKAYELSQPIDVFQGTMLIMQTNKFNKTKKIITMKATDDAKEWVRIGDILHIKIRNKKNKLMPRYLLVEELIENAPNSIENLERVPIDHYYKKVKKGYVKQKLDKDGFPIIPEKKKVRVSANKTVTETEKTDNTPIKDSYQHSFKMRQRNEEPNKD